jgi:calreticulin
MLFSIFAMSSLVGAKLIFKEDFSADGWTDRWVQSDAKGDDAGKIGLTAGKWYADESNLGLQTQEDAKFYQVSTKFAEDFNNKDKNLVVQYSVKHEQMIDCGGAYLKLFPSTVAADLKNFNGESEYNIMFGPDICGSTKRTHFIVNYKGENHLIKQEIPVEADDLSHLYTLILKPDNTFVVKIDGEVRREGSLKDESQFDLLPPKEIYDENDVKPDDWVDAAKIPDPTDEKPAGWDDIEEFIDDPDATKPDDWDDELDGDWAAPKIANPEYQGEWSPRMIDNPDYKGPWEQKKIANPDYYDDDNLYQFDSFAGFGIEVWQVKSGTIFDNFLVTDDIAEADAAADAFKEEQEKEKAMHDEIKEEERKKAEEERLAREAAAEEAEEEGDDEEEEHDEL